MYTDVILNMADPEGSDQLPSCIFFFFLNSDQVQYTGLDWKDLTGC